MSPPKPPPDAARPRLPEAFESDLERHRASDDEVYGAHGVQPAAEQTEPRPASGRSSRGLSRVGQRRRP